MKDKEDFIRDLIAAMKKGRDIDSLVAQWEIAHEDQFDTEEEADNFWQEVIDAAQGHKAPDIKGRQKVESAINKWLSVFKVRGKRQPPKYKQLDILRLEIISIDEKKIKGKTEDQLEKDLEGIIIQMKKYDMEHINKLQQIFDRGSRQMVDDTDKESIQRLDMILEDFYEEVGELDLRKADERIKFYVFWERVQEKYSDLVSAVENLKEALAGARVSKDIKNMIDELEVPPPYIQHFDHVKLEKFRGVPTRLLELLEVLGGKKQSKTAYELSHERTTGEGTEAPYHSQRTPAQLPGEQESKTITSAWEMEGSEIPLDYDVTDLEVDPILLHNILTQVYQMDVGMGEDYEKLVEHLEYIMSNMPEGRTKELINSVLDEVKDAVSDIPEDIIYLPLTDWLKKIDPSIINKIDTITRETGKFFSILNRLLLTSGQHIVSMSPSVGSPERGAAGGSVQVTGKAGTDPKGFRQDRASGSRQTMPESKTEDYSKNLQKLVKELLEALNDYYFHPMSKEGYFIDGEKPEFIDEGGMDFGEELDPDALTREGRFPFKALDIEFGTHPKSSGVKNLLKGLDEENFFDLELLSDLEEHLKKIGKGFELAGGWAAYVQEMEDVIKLLDKLFPDFHDENRIWAAGKIGEILINHQEKSRLSTVKLFGKPINKLYKKYLEMKERGELMPLEGLRGVFSDQSFINKLRREEKFADKDEMKLLNKTIESILKLTEPKEQETSAKEEIEQEKRRLKKSLLVVHDYINKINDRPIYYGTLDVEDIEDMDYLITKIEQEDRIELNTIEISSIVDSINSHNNISKSFGIHENIIYKIRGLCR
jgi:hypothetical protein